MLSPTGYDEPVQEGLDVIEPGLWVHRGAAPPMRGFHRHDDLEINVALRGGLEYLFGGSRVVVPEGSTALFWAATPHRLIEPAVPQPSDVCWIHVPLASVLRWSLPERFASEVMTHGTVVVPTADVGGHVVAQCSTWRRDLADGAGSSAMLLEANALVLRILAHGSGAQDPGDVGARHELRPVGTMARYTAEHFREPITAADIGRAAGLNPNYATTLFRQSTGVTLGDQLVRHRVAEAQRLLVTTSMTTSAIAHAAGFGSQSSLYAHFARACGCSPGAYRSARTALTRRGRPAVR